MNNLTKLVIITLIIAGFTACSENEDDSYPYCVECITTSPGPEVQCFSTEDYAREYLKTKSYLPDTACELYIK